MIPLIFQCKGYGTAASFIWSLFSRTNTRQNKKTEIMWRERESTKKKKYL